MFFWLLNRKQQLICVLLTCCIFIIGCAGRDPNPVPLYIPGDENLNCELLKGEISQLQADMEQILPKTNKAGQNTLCVAGGMILIVPFFFMDLKNAEKVEFEAMRNRHNRLLTYATAKGCEMSGIKAERILSIEEYKKILKEYKKRNPESSNETPIIHVSAEHEFVFDKTTQRGYITVQGKGLEARSWMMKKIGEIASSQNILIQAGEKPQDGFYRILDEDVKDGKYTIEFEIVN